MANRIFSGERTIDGAQVTVDGRELAPQLAVKTFSDRGFEWGYEGNGPKQLALAILAEHWGDSERALSASNEFAARVVANFGNEWQMDSDDIETALANMQN